MRRKGFALGLTCLLAGCERRALGANHSSAEPRGDLLADVRRRGYIRVASDADYLPQSYRNSDGSWTGFDIDVAREVARRLGVRARIDDVSFDLITAGRWSGRYDMHCGSMSITVEREADLLFSQPYYYLPATFAVHAHSGTARIAGLDGKRVGVGRATTYESYFGGTLQLVGEKIVIPPPQTQPISYDTDADAIADLALGDGLRLDGVLSAEPTLRSAIAQGRPLKLIDRPVFHEDIAVALDRFSSVRNATLLGGIDRALGQMHRDGTLSRYSQTYYGTDLSVRR